MLASNTHFLDKLFVDVFQQKSESENTKKEEDVGTKPRIQ